MSVKITKFEMENVKSIRAVEYEPSQNGLTVIGGKNGQGKTSILDSIAWALGGKKFEPTSAMRDGSNVPPELKVELSNGIVVTRKGPNSTLKVLDPSGQKGGQALLDEFIGQLSINLPKFMNMNDKEKAKELLKLLGIESELLKLEAKEQETYAERHQVGKLANSKAHHAEELPSYGDAPSEPISASELIQEQQEIFKKNAENKRIRENKEQVKQQVALVSEEIEMLQAKLNEAMEKQGDLLIALEEAEGRAQNLQDLPTDEIEQKLRDIDDINRKVRANQAKHEAIIEAAELKEDYKRLTDVLEEIREEKNNLLKSVEMPLQGLSIYEGALTYNEKAWDCMSGSEQLKVATAIVRALNPKCGFVLVDKLEQMDMDTMKEFGEWAEQEGLQLIATRVTSNADECSIIISDGRIVEQTKIDWGEF